MTGTCIIKSVPHDASHESLFHTEPMVAGN